MVITDKLMSYVPAIRRVLPNSEHRRHKRLNNRAENSHLPTRKRERILQRFKSVEHVQRFLGPFSAVCNHFRTRRHRLTASAYRRIRTDRQAVWQDVTWAESAADDGLSEDIRAHCVSRRCRAAQLDNGRAPTDRSDAQRPPIVAGEACREHDRADSLAPAQVASLHVLDDVEFKCLVATGNANFL